MMNIRSERPQINPEPIKISTETDVGFTYMGQAQTEFGEIIYCYLVNLGSSMYNYCLYEKAAKQTQSIIQFIASQIKAIIQDNIIHYNVNDFTLQDLMLYTGISSEHECNTLINSIGNKTHTLMQNTEGQIISVKKDENKIKALSITGATGHSIGDYVCYLSKSPTPQNFTTVPTSPCNLQEYIKLYGNILLSVSIEPYINSENLARNDYEIPPCFRKVVASDEKLIMGGGSDPYEKDNDISSSSQSKYIS